MILEGYDEDGNLAFRQGPFTDHLEAVAMFTSEKAEAVLHKIYCLQLINPHAKRADQRIYMSFAR
jgi:hypothetical protein